MSEKTQLAFDFTESTTQRTRTATKQREQIALFPTWVPNLDITIYSATEAAVHVSATGEDLDRAHDWIAGLAGSARPLNRSRFAIPTASLDRFAWTRPPAKVTLDANAHAVASALHAHKLGLKPLTITKHRRLIAESPRGWPSGMKARDIGWPAILALTHLGIPLNIADAAQHLMLKKLAKSGNHIATASLGGSSIYLTTNRPNLLERMELPALSHIGEPGSGNYRIPLLCAEPILNEPTINTPPDVATTIRKANRPAKPLIMGDDFPWTLWDFQSTDAGQGLKILNNTGGVLFAGDMGSGKMEYVNNHLWTPNGPKRIGDIQPGDTVYGTDGNPHTITNTYPQGTKPLYRITFNDGATIRVGAEHLWTTTDPNGNNPHTTNTTNLNPGDHIPIAQPLQKEGPNTLGYTTGALLAAGPNAYHNGTTETMLNILMDMHKAGHTPTPYPNPTARHDITKLHTTLTTDPPTMIGTPLNYRLAALKGIADTTGTWTKKGLLLNTTHPTITQLIQTLGGTTTNTPQGPLAHLPRHIALHAGAPKTHTHTPPKRHITNITPDGHDEAICITVNAPDSLYLTEHGIVTHNTTVSLAVAHEKDLFPLLVVAPLSAFSTWQRQLGEMGRSCYMAVGNAKKNWQEIAENDYDTYLVSYDRLSTFDEILRTKHLKAIIADELQRIRNAGSRRSRSLRALASAVPYRIGLSGTPFVNGLPDLLSQGAFLTPSDWPPRATTKALTDMYPGDPVESVTDQLHSIMVRRRMDQVGKKIAKREDHRIYVRLTTEQREAMLALEEEARRAKEEGEFEGNHGKMNALVKLGRLRKIMDNPGSAGVPGPNPKLEAGMRVIQEMLDAGRRGVVFVNDRPSYKDYAERFNSVGIKWGGIWGSSSAEERIQTEKDLQENKIDIVLCTVAAAAESWTASPFCDWAVFNSTQYQPAISAQSEGRVHRLSSNVDGPVVRIIYLHAKDPVLENTVDDRILEILLAKKALAEQIVDKRDFVDGTDKTTLGDLLYMITGASDEQDARLEADQERAAQVKVKQKEHAKNTIYRKKRGSAR